jgi:hypothetical protein
MSIMPGIAHHHTGVNLGEGMFINATTARTPEVRIDDLREP